MKNIFAFVILLLSLTIFCQETSRKNFHTVGITGGGAMVMIWTQGNYGLEAIVFREHERKIPFTLYLHAKRIHMGTWGLNLKGTYGGLGVFTGQKNVHLDFNIGFGHFMEKYSSEEEGIGTEIDSGVLPTGYLGFRLQSPNGWVSFRAGGGFPEIGSIGVGFHFL